MYGTSNRTPRRRAERTSPGVRRNGSGASKLRQIRSTSRVEQHAAKHRSLVGFTARIGHVRARAGQCVWRGVGSEVSRVSRRTTSRPGGAAWATRWVNSVTEGGVQS